MDFDLDGGPDNQKQQQQTIYSGHKGKTNSVKSNSKSVNVGFGRIVSTRPPVS